MFKCESLLFRTKDVSSNIDTIFLAVQYNPEALRELLNLAKSHGLLDQIILKKNEKGFNILQFATLNKSPECLKYVQSFLQNISLYISIRTMLEISRHDENSREDWKKKLFTSRNIDGECALQTAR